MKTCIRPVAVAAATAALILSVPAAAHPHVWIEARVEFRFDEAGRIDALDVYWAFDEFYSLFAVEGLDTNKDGEFSPDELRPLAEANLKELAGWSYFTFPKADGTPLDLAPPQDFNSSYDDGLLSMRFVTPLEMPVDPATATMSLRLYDPTYYIAIDLSRNDPVALSGAVPAGCSANVGSIFNEPLPESQTLMESMFDDVSKTQTMAESFSTPVQIVCGEQGAQ